MKVRDIIDMATSKGIRISQNSGLMLEGLFSACKTHKEVETLMSYFEILAADRKSAISEKNALPSKPRAPKVNPLTSDMIRVGDILKIKNSARRVITIEGDYVITGIIEIGSTGRVIETSMVAKNPIKDFTHYMKDSNWVHVNDEPLRDWMISRPK